MAREKIQDNTGKIIGWFEDVGTKIWITDFYGRKLGYYDKQANETRE